MHLKTMKIPDLTNYEELIAGFCGGAVCAVVCHPFDLLKVRFSANEGNALRPQYASYADAVRKIVAVEGVRGLYQGWTPGLIGASVSWGFYFQWYNALRTKINKDFSTGSEIANNFISGLLAGSAVQCFTNPIWLAKTRLCLQYETQKAKKYTGMIDCLSKTVQQEGFFGLYRGFVTGVIGSTHGSVQIVAYNWIRDKRCEAQGLPKDSFLKQTDIMLASSISKMLATTVTFPFQFIRTRMQDHNTDSRGIWRTTLKTVKNEGVLGLWKGCLIANVRQLPASVVVFLTYENVKRLVGMTKDQ
uniref:Mitochondrial folate transporter/carrier n=2 Tax=Caenorhabditis tropicalis TaxID=1561998 RepID=A0A1I7UDI5_9PELO